MRLACLIAIQVAAVFLFTFPFMWLWNYAVCSAVTFANPIDYWVAFCLLIFLSMFIVSGRSSK